MSENETKQQNSESSTQTPPPAERRLHLGGKDVKEGWEILNIQDAEGVDHVGDATDLSRFEDNTFTELYASHIAEHLDYTGQLQAALQEWFRVLQPGGKLYLAVPDLEMLAKILLAKDQTTLEQRMHVIRMIFGGHVDPYDYHVMGFTQELLAMYLSGVGFKNIIRTGRFGFFDRDASNIVFLGVPISLNVIAIKPAD
jgi:predicted SAM-dependent methyltransferase